MGLNNRRRLVDLLMGWFFLLVGFCGFFFWAASYPLEQGVSGNGFVISKDEKLTIFAPIAGLVENIHKKSGDNVIKGEVLVEIDSSVLNYSLRSNKQALLGLQASNSTLQNAYTAKSYQVAAIQKQFLANKKLMEAGFLSQYALLNTQNQLALAESEALEIQSKIDLNNFKIKEIEENSLGIVQQIKLHKIISPVSGSIMNSTIKSSGTSVSQSQPLMDIVPQSDGIVIDAKLPVEFIDQVKLDASVDITFPSLSGNKTVHIPGKLDYVSADKLTDSKTGQAYLEARISIVDKSNPQLSLVRVGLPATVIINTKPRTLMSYITRPFMDRLSMGLK